MVLKVTVATIWSKATATTMFLKTQQAVREKDADGPTIKRKQHLKCVWAAHNTSAGHRRGTPH
jgi:hypothetical protein